MKIWARKVGSTKIDENECLVIYHQRLRDSDFSNRKLIQLSIAGSRLQGCRFDNSRIESASFGEGRETSEYIECSFDGCRIDFGPGGYARFVRCSFRNVDLCDWFCFGVELIQCTFTGRMRTAVFNASVPENKRAMIGRASNEFRDNDFSSMELIAVSFRTGIDLSQQRLPSGPQYLYLPDAASAVRQVRSQVLSWEPDLREPAMVLTNELEEELKAGQRQLLLRASDYYSALRRADVVDRVFALLREAAK